MKEQIAPATLKMIEELQEDQAEKKKKYEFMTQKHTKKEYDSLKKMSVSDIFDCYSIEKKKVKFEDGNDFQDIIKIEKKKKKLAKKKERLVKQK